MMTTTIRAGSRLTVRRRMAPALTRVRVRLQAGRVPAMVARAVVMAAVWRQPMVSEPVRCRVMARGARVAAGRSLPGELDRESHPVEEDLAAMVQMEAVMDPAAMAQAQVLI